MDVFTSEFLARLRDKIEQTNALGRLSDWLTRHTTLHTRPYSFKDHEYQLDILNDKHHDVVVRKPSQVGMSEAMARLALAFLAVTPGIASIITFPTVHEALRFAKSRIDPVIRGSKYLSSILQPGSDSSSFKQLGESQLFMAGTYGKALISIPTDLLLNDEVDFSNKEALITAESRLTHSRFVDEETGARGIKRRFSTPTAEAIGVSHLYEISDQRVYMVRCQRCSHQFWPQFHEHVVVDGFDGSIRTMTYMDVMALEEQQLLRTARILCPKCTRPLTRENLTAPYREWVPKFPSRRTRGYAVSPFDLPLFHTPESVMRKMLDYRGEVGHFHNFVLGLPYSDASNSILREAIERNTIVQWVPPSKAHEVSGTVFGVDVGRVSWLMIGKRIGPKLHILHLEQISIRGSATGTELIDTVIERARQYKCVQGVIDGMPFTSDSLQIAAAFPPGMVRLSMFTLTDRKLPTYHAPEESNELSVNRNKILNAVAAHVNSDKILFPAMNEMKIASKHMQSIKRVDRVEENGDEVQQWVSEGDDHYAFSLAFLLLADMMLQERMNFGWAPMPGLTEVNVGAKVPKPEENTRRVYASVA